MDSDSTNLGSNPSPPANNETRRQAGFVWVEGMGIRRSLNESDELEPRHATAAARTASA